MAGQDPQWVQRQRAGGAAGDALLRARIGPFTVTELVRVVAVVEEPDRVGFAYGTRPGHPVSGEEAFVCRRDERGEVELVLRSLTAPAPRGGWRLLYPLTLLAQRRYRARYRRALLPGVGDPRTRRAAVWALLALLCIGLGTLGLTDPGGYVVVRALLDHVFVLGVLAVGFATVAVATLLPRAATGLRVVGLLVAVVWAAIGVLAHPGPTSSRVVGPPGLPEDVVVRSYPDQSQPGSSVFELSVRSRRGLASREWRVACLYDFDPLPLRLLTRRLTVDVDPVSGEPNQRDVAC